MVLFDMGFLDDRISRRFFGWLVLCFFNRHLFQYYPNIELYFPNNQDWESYWLNKASKLYFNLMKVACVNVELHNRAKPIATSG